MAALERSGPGREETRALLAPAPTGEEDRTQPDELDELSDARVEALRARALDGVRSTRERVLATQPVTYLQHEPACDPWKAPCAAFGSDRAIVVGPGGDGLQVKTTGFAAGSVVAAAGELLDADDRVVAEITFAPANLVWRLRVADGAARRLRVRIRATNETTVAEFPLPR